MHAESDAEMSEAAKERPSNITQWQKIQDHFAEIIGANIYLLTPPSVAPSSIPPITHQESAALPYISKVTPSCAELAVCDEIKNRPTESLCIDRVYQSWLELKRPFVKCDHLLNYAVREVAIAPNPERQILLVGPIFLGKRDDKNKFVELCRDLGLDCENFIDCLHELKSFSFSGIENVLNLLEEISESFIRPSRLASS